MDENLRKLIHILFGLPIFLLLFLNWWQATLIAFIAFIHNIFILPLYGRKIFRAKWDRGIILYPLSVMLVLILFRERLWVAAAAWSLLSFSDGLASIVGKKSNRKLPWNKEKTLHGTGAFIISGVILSPFFYWLIKGSFSVRELLIVISAVILTGLFESFDTGVDDNIIVPFAFLYFFRVGEIVRLSPFSAIEVKMLIIIAVFSFLVYVFKLLDLPGTISAFIVGTGVLHFGGIKIFIILLGFFLLSETASFFKKSHKGSIKRGWQSVWAKGGPALLFSILGFPQGAVVSLAEATYDTVATEIGSVSGSFVFSPIKMKRVKRGESGGISPEGSIAGFFSAFLLLGLSVWLGISIDYTLAALIIVLINLLEPILKLPCHTSHSFANFITAYVAGEIYIITGIL